jgi:hypothetical protein
MFVADDKSAGLNEPGAGSLRAPALLAAPQLLSAVQPLPVDDLPVSRHPFDSCPLRPPARRVGAKIRNGEDVSVPLPWPALRVGEGKFCEGGRRNRQFCRLVALRQSPQREKRTLHPYHPLRPIAVPGLSDRVAPFRAAMKSQARYLSCHLTKISRSGELHRTRHASCPIASSWRYFDRRRQPAREGDLVGRMPLCRSNFRKPKNLSAAFTIRRSAPAPVTDSKPWLGKQRTLELPMLTLHPSPPHLHYRGSTEPLLTRHLAA